MANFFSSGTKKTYVTPTLKVPAYAKKAISFLESLYGSEPPTLPTLSIAGLGEGEQAGYEGLLKWGTTEPEGYGTSLAELIKTAEGGYLDITKTPWFEPVISRGKETMNTAMNRGMQALQKRGTLTSGPGESIIGKIIREAGEGMVGTLAPYSQGARSEQMNAVLQLLNGIGDKQILSRIMSLLSYTTPRDIENARNQAAYSQEHEQVMFPYDVQAPIAQSIMGYQPLDVSGATQVTQNPSMFSQIMPMAIAAILMGAMGGGGAGAGTVSNPVNTFAANPTSGNAALIKNAWLGGM